MVGPTGFTTTTRRVEIKPGGQWRFVMHGPDGTDYENIITFIEVTAPSRLSYKHSGDKETEAIKFEVEVDFATRTAGPASPCACASRRTPSATSSSRSTAPSRGSRRRWGA